MVGFPIFATISTRECMRVLAHAGRLLWLHHHVVRLVICERAVPGLLEECCSPGVIWTLKHHLFEASTTAHHLAHVVMIVCASTVRCR